MKTLQTILASTALVVVLSNVYGYTGTTGDSRNDTHANQIPPEVTQSCGSFALE